MSCPSGACLGTRCLQTCTADDGCDVDAGLFCSAQGCDAKRSTGVACTRAGECAADDAGFSGDGGGCVPRTCASAGVVCGMLADGCGTTLSCGTVVTSGRSCPTGESAVTPGEGANLIVRTLVRLVQSPRG